MIHSIPLYTAEHIQAHYLDKQKEQWLVASVAMAKIRKVGAKNTAMANSQLLMQHWLTQGVGGVSTPG
jgi:hypothetical protein